MTAISRSLLLATTVLLEWDALGHCQSEDELRTALMGAFLHTQEARPFFILLREVDAPIGFDKRLDLYLLPSWPPRQKAVAVGEMKFFRQDRPTDYRTRLGSRLSDIHYVQSLAFKERLHSFFFDIVLNRKLVGKECYESLKDMCKVAAENLYHPVNPIRESELKNLKGVKAFATASIDHTPRKLLRRMKYDFLFPPMDLPGGSGRAKRGPAFVRAPNKEGLISIGVRKSGKEQVIPYRAFTTNDNVEAAVCLAVFDSTGHLVVSTDDLITNLAKR